MLSETFGATFVSGSCEFEPTYNAAPAQMLPIITTYAPGEIVMAQWGFLPEEWSNPRIRPQNNARVETAAEKPLFRTSFAGRHCLALADRRITMVYLATTFCPVGLARTKLTQIKAHS